MMLNKTVARIADSVLVLLEISCCIVEGHLKQNIMVFQYLYQNIRIIIFSYFLHFIKMYPPAKLKYDNFIILERNKTLISFLLL